MAISSFSGLASGVQWRDLIDQIIEQQRAPIKRLSSQQSAMEAKQTAWASFRKLAQSLQTAAAGLAAGTSMRASAVTVENRSTGAAPLTVSPTATAAPGAYRVDVISLAAAEKLGGSSFDSNSTALGIDGTVVVGGRALTLAASDSLTDIAQRFNELNTGSAPSGVSASVLASGSGSYRLVLTADEPGAAGLDLRDAGGSVLRQLGLVDTATRTTNPLAAGARSASFSSSDRTIGSLLGLSTAPASTLVEIGTQTFNIDLANDTLASIAAKIDGVGGLSASVVADTTGESESFRLEVTGTTRFVDAGGVLETLGMVAATRTSATQEVRSGVYTSGGSTADASSTLVGLADAVGASAGVLDGDRLTLAGTRADGSTFSILMDITAATTLGDVVDRLNSADGYGADPANSLRPTATAKVEGGQLVVTDGASRDSALALTMTAADPDTGTARDLSEVNASTVGRTRLLTRASDAVLSVDGAFVKRSSNTVSDVLDGVTLNLSGTGTVDITVARDANGAVGSIKGFIKAYNDLATFVGQQLAPPPTGSKALPLYGEATLRTMQYSLRETLRTTLASDVAGSLTRLTDIGVEVDRYGQFQVDQTKLEDSVRNRFSDVERFFGITGTSSNTLLSYVGSSTATGAGLYNVDITQAATAASATGIDFDLANPAGYAGLPTDTIKVKDLLSGSTYEVALTAGMRASDVADALNAAFGTATTRLLENDVNRTLTGASTTTLLADLQIEGVDSDIQADDLFTISGTRPDGSAFTTSFSAAADADLGDLIEAVQTQVGPDATVSLTDGQLQVLANRTGSSALSLTVVQERTATNLFGSFTATREGRPVASITASGATGSLSLSHSSYGSAAGFQVSYSDTVVGDPFGFGADPIAGLDVAGTIDGELATGAGRTLTGKTGTASEGLILSYAGAPDATLTLRFSRGIGALAEAAAKALTQAGTGTIDGVTARLDERIQQLADRADTLEQRLETRREALIRQFTAMEAAMSKAQSQSAWLTAQLAQFDNSRK